MPITIAVPKGRLLEPSLAALRSLGITIPEGLDASGRELHQANSDITVFLTRARDVPLYLRQGGAHLGVVGLDRLRESGCRAGIHARLGFGRCRLVVASPEETDWPLPSPVRVGTGYPRLTRMHFAVGSTQVRIVPLSGSVEIAPRAGLCDAVVDIVETGSTLRANGLVIRETIMESEAVLAVSARAARMAQVRSLLTGLGEEVGPDACMA